jgi:hypothetical protein
MQLRVHLSERSANRKTGPIPITTSSSNTCPQSCPMKEKGCYAKGGPLRIHWKKVDNGERGMEWKDFLKAVQELPDGSVWRHNQAGDLVGSRNKINKQKALQLARANEGKHGFTYTHYKVDDESQAGKYNREVVKLLNEQGFIVNLSADGPAHADRLCKLGVGPVTTVLLSTETRKVSYTPEGRKIILCPAVVKEEISCAKCKLCALPMEKRKFIIGFPAHGVQKRHIDKSLEEK